MLPSKRLLLASGSLLNQLHLYTRLRAASAPPWGFVTVSRAGLTVVSPKVDLQQIL